MKYNKFILVGCGGLGSLLAVPLYLYISKYNENAEFILIDPDIISSDEKLFSNAPTELLNQYKNLSKSLLLKTILEATPVCKKINVSNICDIFPNAPYKYNIKLDNQTFFIDCRDSSVCNSDFNIKCSIDGDYGNIIINPFDSKGANVNYKFKYNPLAALLFSNEIIYTIDDYISNDKNEYCTKLYKINLKGIS